MNTELKVAAQDSIDRFELTPEDRVLGYIAWRLVGDWKGWVRRRVESIAYETATSVRRRVSVDMRFLPEVFDEPVVSWGGEEIHLCPDRPVA